MGKGDKRREDDTPRWANLEVVGETKTSYIFKERMGVSVLVSKQAVDKWFETVGEMKGMKLKRKGK